MARRTRSKKTPWQAKAMGALALAAVFGLPAGAAIGAEVPLDTTEASYDFNFGTDTYTVTASGKVTASGVEAMETNTDRLAIDGDLVLGGATAPDSGFVEFTGTNALTVKAGKITANKISIGGSTADLLNLGEDTKKFGLFLGDTAAAPNPDSGATWDAVIAANTLDYSSTQKWTLDGVALNIADGGSLIVAGDVSGADGLAIDGLTDTSTLSISGAGTLSMTSANDNLKGRKISFSETAITGGAIDISGKYDNATSSKHETAALHTDVGNASGSFELSDGMVNLGDYGTISVAATGATDFAVNITGGTINMNGTDKAKAALLWAMDSGDANQKDTVLNIEGDTAIAVANGAIVARETTMNGGSINVSAYLAVAGTYAFQDDADIDVLDNLSAASNQGGVFTLADGAITNTGIIDFVTGEVEFNANGGTLTGGLAVVDAVGTDMGMAYAKKVTVDATDFVVDSLHIGTGLTAGDLTINAGRKLTVASGGALTIESTPTTNSIEMGGTLSVDFDKVLALDAESEEYELIAAVADILTAIGTDDTGTLNLTSSTAIGYTVEQLAALKDLLGIGDGATHAFKLVLANGGLVDESGNPATVSVEDADPADGTANLDGSESSGGTNPVSITETATASGDDKVVTIAGSDLTSKNINISDATTTQVILDSQDFTMSGNGLTADDALLTKGADGAGGLIATVALDNASLTLGEELGDSAVQQGGQVGNIVFAGTTGEADALNVNDGDFKTGSITATDEAAATVAVDGAKLAAGAIDLQTVTEGASVSLTGSTLTAGNITFGAADSTKANELSLDSSNATVGDITFGDSTDAGSNSISVAGGALTAGDIIGGGTANSLVQINVGTVGPDGKAGHVLANKVQNAQIILDPVFPGPSSTYTVAQAEDIDLAILQNGWFLLDEAKDKTWMEAQLAMLPNGKLSEDGYNAALALRAPMLLGTDKELVVDGTDTDGDYTFGSKLNNATFGDGSLLIVDAGGLRNAQGVTSEAAIEAKTAGTAVVDAGATLKIVGGSAGDVITVLKNFTTVTGVEGWGLTDVATLLFDTKYITGDPVANDTINGYQVTIEADEAAIDKLGNDYPLLSNGMVDMLQDFLYDGAYAPNSKNAGIAFVSNLLRNDLGLTPTEVARTVEGAARIVAAAGVPTLAANLNTQVSSLIVGHNSMLNDAQPAYGSEPGQLGLWLSPFYGMSDVDGMKAGHFENGYEMNYGGAAFGLDYNISESFRLGLALNAGGGDTESEGDFNKTENDFDFWGLNLYSSYSNGAFGLTGDIGYTVLNSEITQEIPSLARELRADGDSDIFTVGLTGEYKISTETGIDVTPHAGLRYSKISTNKVDVELRNGGDVFEIDTDDQNLFQIPLGVKVSSDIVTNGGWTVSPKADVGVLFTTGDTDVDSKATIAGTSYSGVTNTEVVDEVAFTGALGIQAKADSGLSLGLEYGVLAGGNQTDHQFSGMLRFDF